MWGGDYGGNRYFSKLFLLIKTYQYNFFQLSPPHQIQQHPHARLTAGFLLNENRIRHGVATAKEKPEPGPIPRSGFLNAA